MEQAKHIQVLSLGSHTASIKTPHSRYDVPVANNHRKGFGDSFVSEKYLKWHYFMIKQC